MLFTLTMQLIHQSSFSQSGKHQSEYSITYYEIRED